VIQPAYRHAFELMPPVDGDAESGAGKTWREASKRLQTAPVLVRGSKGRRFVPAAELHHVERRETLQRLDPELDIAVFVLQGHTGARAPLRVYFGREPLERLLKGVPEADECELSAEERDVVRHKLSKVAPYLLCRLEADRSSDRELRGDARPPAVGPGSPRRAVRRCLAS
jgi:hypothetical protein